MPCARTGWPCLSASRGEAGTGVRVHVDEAGRDDEARASIVRTAGRGPERPDRLDAIADDADVGADPRVAGRRR